MSSPSAFEVSRHIGNNLSGAFRKANDENAIESILSSAIESGDPQVLQNSIGKILSQVSPERQASAVEYLQSSYKNVLQKQELQRQREAALRAGVEADLPPAVQAAQFKESAKTKRLQNIYGSPSTNASNVQSPQGGLKPFSDDQIVQLTGHPDKEVSEPAKAEQRRRETERKEMKKDIRESRKESLKYKETLIDRGDVAKQSIANKTRQFELIDRGNLNDPTYATFLENLPFGFGKRLLSDDTVEYKAGLVDDFRDLRNLFTGTTRVKEIEILEAKIADTYLTDSQKKAVLKARINANKADVILAEVAAEVDEKHPDLGLIAFRKKVEELAKPKLDALGESIIGDTAAVFEQAEKRKKIPLDPKDPEDAKILQQILKEVGGDKNKARELAKRKGYKF